MEGGKWGSLESSISTPANRATTSLDPSFFHKWNNCQNNTRNPLPPPTASWDIWRYFGSSWGCCTVAPHVSCQNTKVGQVFKHGNNQRNHFPYFHDQWILVKYFWFGNSKPPPLVSGNNYNKIFHQTIFHNSTFPISSLMQNHRCRYFVNTLLNDIFISLRSTIKSCGICLTASFTHKSEVQLTFP